MAGPIGGSSPPRASRIVVVDAGSTAQRAPALDEVPAGSASDATPRFRPIVWVDAVLAAFWNHPALFGLLAALAVLSGVWGFISFYGPQYGKVPWYLWPFVPDSPLAVSAWLVAAIALKLGWDQRAGPWGAVWAFFAGWAIVWNAKVGIWTPFVLLYYHDVFFAGRLGYQIFQGVLLVAHLGMLAFALLLFRKVRALRAAGFVGILAVVFLWDFMDYFFVSLFLPGSGIQVFPLGVPAEPERLRVTAFLSLVLSVSLTLALTIGIRLRGPPSPR